MKSFGLLLLMFFVINAACQTDGKKSTFAQYAFLQMQSSPFRATPQYLSKHDIVFKAPTQLPAEGFPMGNGNIGGMIWNHDNGIELQINKNDLWTAPVKEEDDLSILKHAARLKIDFGAPVFSWIHLKDFTGRLSLLNGEVSYQASTAYSSTKINTWVAAGKNVWVLECINEPNDSTMAGGLTATVSLERIGSRAFPGWYAGHFSKNVAAGIGHTEVKTKGKDIILNETGDGLYFTVACRIINGSNSPEKISAHAATAQVKAPAFTVIFSVVSNKESINPEQDAINLLNEAEQKTMNKLKSEKDNWYRAFWSNSFVKLGNDYLENIYYLRRYLMAAGSQGRYPVAFNGGLWRWNRDVMNWVTPHHWNTQQQYFGLCAQNDARLMKPYLNTYFKMMPQAEALAKERGSPNGLLIAEGHNFDGAQVLKDREDMDKNYTPASQIALLFWDYYEFTGDKKFLRDTAYVFMKKAAQFYIDKLQWDKSKNEYYLLSSLYESAEIDEVKNAITDRDCIEALFNKCIASATLLNVDANLIKKWKYIIAHLWQRKFIDDKECGELIAPAEAYFTNNRYTSFIWSCGGLIAFPSGIIGINERNTRWGNAVANMIRCRKDVNAHYPAPIIAARMGMGDEALTYLLNGINIHQMYPQGLMTNVTGYPDNIYNLKSVHDLLGGKHKIRSDAFFQAGMEPISNYATAINEMLLQSNEQKIRVFAAIPQEWKNKQLAFTLLARGAFIVSSQQKSGKVQQVGIKSLRGNDCSIQNPWPGKPVAVYNATKNLPIEVKEISADLMRFSTKINEEYIIVPAGLAPLNEPEIISGQTNQLPKKFRNRLLGKESGWDEGYKNLEDTTQ